MFKNQISETDYNDIMKDAKIIKEAEEKNVVIYRNMIKNIGIKRIKTDQDNPSTSEELKRSVGWTEFYFLCILNKKSILFPSLLGYYKGSDHLCIISKWVEGTTLFDLLKTKNNFDVLSSIYYQIFIASYILYKKYNIVHGDFIPHNILLRKIDIVKDSYLCYEIDGKKYFIKNVGWIPVIWDFEFSRQRKKSGLISYYKIDEIISKEKFDEKIVDLERISGSLHFDFAKENKYFFNYLFLLVKNYAFQGFEKTFDFLLDINPEVIVLHEKITT